LAIYVSKGIRYIFERGGDGQQLRVDAVQRWYHGRFWSGNGGGAGEGGEDGVAGDYLFADAQSVGGVL
jgi:hypothetical protein